MEQVSIIGIDLAKRVFQAHGAAADGSVVFRKKLSRGQFLAFLAAQQSCTVAMEACATAHGWFSGPPAQSRGPGAPGCRQQDTDPCRR